MSLHEHRSKRGKFLCLLMSERNASSYEAATAAGKGGGATRPPAGGKRHTENTRETPPKIHANDADEVSRVTHKRRACSLQLSFAMAVAVALLSRTESEYSSSTWIESRNAQSEDVAPSYLRFTQQKYKPVVEMQDGRDDVRMMYDELAEKAGLDVLRPDTGIGRKGLNNCSTRINNIIDNYTSFSFNITNYIHDL